MPTVFLISDTHFGHAGMCRFLNQDGSKVRPWDNPDEMDEAMVDNWNRVVKTGDKVYHLGDVAMAKKNLAILSRLNGRKVLIKGNHDIFKIKDYAEHFYDVRASHKLGNFILTHIPVHPDSITNRWCAGNVHGHMHNNVIDDPRYHNVSVERINYTPYPFDELNRPG